MRLRHGTTFACFERTKPVVCRALIIRVLLGCVGVSLLTSCGETPSVSNPLAGTSFFVPSDTPASSTAASLERTHPATAALLRRISEQPTAIWLGTWTPTDTVAASVEQTIEQARKGNRVPVFVLYAIPNLDCGGYSAGGFPDVASYLGWVRQIAKGIGSSKVIVILEPDALASITCLTSSERQQRLSVLRDAVDVVSSLPHVFLYIDAGNSAWRTPSYMARLLEAAGIRSASGFSLNVSNFKATRREQGYGDELSRLLSGKHFVIDTSRNGRATATNWCNPPNQALGHPPTTQTGDPLNDAWLWIKFPGKSDGPCNGGPPAGTFWVDYAVHLVQNAA